MLDIIVCVGTMNTQIRAPIRDIKESSSSNYAKEYLEERNTNMIYDLFWGQEQGVQKYKKRDRNNEKDHHKI